MQRTYMPPAPILTPHKILLHVDDDKDEEEACRRCYSLHSIRGNLTTAENTTIEGRD